MCIFLVVLYVAIVASLIFKSHHLVVVPSLLALLGFSKRRCVCGAVESVILAGFFFSLRYSTCWLYTL